MSALENNSKKTNGHTSIHGAQDQLIADFKALIADADALLRATANQGGEKLDEVRAKAQKSLRAVTHRLAEFEGVMLARTREAAKAADAYVHDNPWKAAGVAGGFGLLVGLLLRRN